MPKVSTSTSRSTHQEGKRRSKHRGHQYRDATKVRKLRKTRFKGIVEAAIKSVKSGKPRLLKRTPKVDVDWFGCKMQANSEENRLVSAPIISAEVYTANTVNLNVPRVLIIQTFEATDE